MGMDLTLHLRVGGTPERYVWNEKAGKEVLQPATYEHEFPLYVPTLADVQPLQNKLESFLRDNFATPALIRIGRAGGDNPEPVERTRRDILRANVFADVQDFIAAEIYLPMEDLLFQSYDEMDRAWIKTHLRPDQATYIQDVVANYFGMDVVLRSLYDSQTFMPEGVGDTGKGDGGGVGNG